MTRLDPIEALRKIISPGREVEEAVAKLDPATALDSQIRDFLCRIVEQKGPVTVRLDVPNTGSVRWEIVTFEPTPGRFGHTEATIWHVPPS